MDTENPYAPGVEIQDSPVVDATFHVPTSRIFVAWLCFFLVATLGGGVAGAIVGGFLGFVLASAGTDMGTLRLVCQVGGFVVALPISFLCYWWSVQQFVLKELKSPQDGKY